MVMGMEPNSSRKSWLSLVFITISLLMNPITGTGGWSSSTAPSEHQEDIKQGHNQHTPNSRMNVSLTTFSPIVGTKIFHRISQFSL